MPLYNTATAAAALRVPHKWIDNLLSHHNIAGTESAKQGVARRLSDEIVGRIAVVRALTQGGMLTSAAVALADRLWDDPEPIILAPAVSIHLNLPELKQWLRDRLAASVEVIPTPARGRPPRS